MWKMNDQKYEKSKKIGIIFGTTARNNGHLVWMSFMSNVLIVNFSQNTDVKNCPTKRNLGFIQIIVHIRVTLTVSKGTSRGGFLLRQSM